MRKALVLALFLTASLSAGGRARPREVPEFDFSAGTSAVALLAIGCLILARKKRRTV